MEPPLNPPFEMHRRLRAPASRGLRFGIAGLIVLILVLLIGARWAASIMIEYSWWKELGQVHTWIDLYAYSTLPITGATFITWIVFLIAHARAVRFSGGQVSDYPIYSRMRASITGPCCVSQAADRCPARVVFTIRSSASR